jgi:hypothetical protein
MFVGEDQTTRRRAACRRGSELHPGSAALVLELAETLALRRQDALPGIDVR